MKFCCQQGFLPVTHRHYVFSIPKILRTYFRYNRKLLGRLSRCAYETVKEMMQEALEDNAAVPGMIAAIRTFGSDIDWHPHLHCLVTNGAFTPDGTFHAMEIPSPSIIMEIFQHKVFRMLLKEGLITEACPERSRRKRVRLILSWRPFDKLRTDIPAFIYIMRARLLQTIVEAGSVLQDTLSDPLYPWNVLSKLLKQNT